MNGKTTTKNGHNGKKKRKNLNDRDELHKQNEPEYQQ